MSVLKTLKGKKQKSRKHHYWEIHSPFQQAVRMGKWKAIRYGTKETLELYDLSTDSGETKNVAAEHLYIIRKLENFLKTARTPSPYFPAKEYANSK